MLPYNTIQNELEALGCTSLATKLSLPYVVPAGYFNAFSVNVINTVNNQDELLSIAPSLTQADKKQNTYTAPNDYFNTLSNNVLAGIKSIEENTLLQKSIDTTVPHGYFDSLANNILTKIKETETPVVVLQPRKKSWIKYAVAAAIVGLIALTGIRYFTPATQTDTAVVTTVNAGVSKSLQSVPENELEVIVTTLANEAVSEKTATTNIVTNNKNDVLVANLLNEVSTTELASFLNEFDEDADDENFGTLN